MAISFQRHPFELDGDLFVGNHIPERHLVSVFRERDQQFIAAYALDQAASTAGGHPGYWQSIHTGTSLALLERLQPAVAALPLEQPWASANSTQQEATQ